MRFFPIRYLFLCAEFGKLFAGMQFMVHIHGFKIEYFLVADLNFAKASVCPGASLASDHLHR
jgi:hypothetical protein